MTQETLFLSNTFFTTSENPLFGPRNSRSEGKQKYVDSTKEWIRGTDLINENANIKSDGDWTVLVRAALPGTSGWSHQYGNAANTSTVDDERIRGGVRVLWYGDPGPSTMTNRHEGAVGPISVAGRLFTQGEHSVMAYDAFNGEFLWEQYNV